jgi:spore coat polysaccharide biosynthesis predicted glycosyltransferase SpsG
MRLVFRADASHQIGSGHVMRITTIAEEAISRGIECCFVGQIDQLNWVNNRVNEMGFKNIVKDVDSFTPDANNDVLVIDSYTTPIGSQYNLLENWKLLVCVKDPFTPNTTADLFVNQSLRNPEQKVSNVLDGPMYSLIRKEIEKTKKIESCNLKILVSGGGSDPFGFVKVVLNELRNIDLPLEVHAFTSEALGSYGELKLRVHEIGPALDLIAGQVDLVITTASTSSTEFIAREVPILVSCVVNNQESFYKQLSKLNYAIPIGVRASNGDWNLDREVIISAISTKSLRDELRNNIKGVIDLFGPKRVVDEIELRAKGVARR